MGYTTDFSGEFDFDEPLTPEQVAYLAAFNKTRRMARDEEKVAKMPDPVREADGLPVGFEGSYFVGGDGDYGQDRDDSILDFNEPPGGELTGFIIPTGPQDGGYRKFGLPCPMPEPHVLPWVPGSPVGSNHAPGHGCTYGTWRKKTDLGQPGLWCQWVPSDDGTTLAWDEGEKFYNYIEWLQYLIGHFIKPWGRILSGEVYWQGEESDDFGKIVVRDNEVLVCEGKRTYAPEAKV